MSTLLIVILVVAVAPWGRARLNLPKPGNRKSRQGGRRGKLNEEE
jgi:hypothetical protein